MRGFYAPLRMTIEFFVSFERAGGRGEKQREQRISPLRAHDETVRRFGRNHIFRGFGRRKTSNDRSKGKSRSLRDDNKKSKCNRDGNGNGNRDGNGNHDGNGNGNHDGKCNYNRKATATATIARLELDGGGVDGGLGVLEL